ncbi:unnamed protein product [Urochloa humidicola]
MELRRRVRRGRWRRQTPPRPPPSMLLEFLRRRGRPDAPVLHGRPELHTASSSWMPQPWRSSTPCLARPPLDLRRPWARSSPRTSGPTATGREAPPRRRRGRAATAEPGLNPLGPLRPSASTRSRSSTPEIRSRKKGRPRGRLVTTLRRRITPWSGSRPLEEEERKAPRRPPLPPRAPWPPALPQLEEEERRRRSRELADLHRARRGRRRELRWASPCRSPAEGEARWGRRGRKRGRAARWGIGEGRWGRGRGWGPREGEMGGGVKKIIIVGL